jgi:CHAP domain
MGKLIAVGLASFTALFLAVGCSSPPSDATGSTKSASSGFPGCSGLFNDNPSPTGAYYATDFGCSSNPYFTDPGDTCGSAACIQSAFDQGVCPDGQSDADCQRAVNWYSVGGASYGCGARLNVTNPANGKSVVVMVLDNGPSCSVENDANFWVLDVSYPTIMYLFGSEEGWSDQALINAVQVDPSTPLGPSDGTSPSSPSSGPSCTIDTGEDGTCIDTSACASMGGTSTPGFCPGADNIQCCTGSNSQGDAGADSSPGGDAGPGQGDAGADAGPGGDAGGPAASTGATVASIAQANVGLGACSTNSQGGTAFETSCDGNGGEPEYWCADFAQWVWQQAGANTDGLDAAAQSFYDYGQSNGTFGDTPAIGDAVVFDNGSGIHHVAIVVQVNGDGSIETVSGDWDGQGSSESGFASTSSVVLNAPAYDGSVGTEPGIMGMTLVGYIAPVFDGSGTVASAPSCTVTTTGEQGTCIDTSACASMGGTSTPDYCPGADNIQCCTGL